VNPAQGLPLIAGTAVNPGAIAWLPGFRVLLTSLIVALAAAAAGYFGRAECGQCGH